MESDYTFVKVSNITAKKITSKILKNLEIFQALPKVNNENIVDAYFSESPHMLYDRLKPAIKTQYGMDFIKLGYYILYEEGKNLPLAVIHQLSEIKNEFTFQ